MSKPPPQSYPRSLNLIFASDPFDARFINNDAGRTLTALGAVCNTWFYLERFRNETKGLCVSPVCNTLRVVMSRECPDTLAELEEYMTRNQHEFT